MAPASKSKNFAVESAFMNELVALFSDSDLTTLELETDDIAVKLSRGSEGATVMMPQMAQMGQPAPAVPAASAAPAAPAAPAVEVTPDASHPGAVKSPMVGTVYEGPEPGAPAFIKEGDTVKKGQTLFIVEAMKVMNPIASTLDGTVTKILVQNAQPVEFDQALVIIE
jgi:acetyl-CoA carboxylase biotin carboxyl carrier protein